MAATRAVSYRPSHCTKTSPHFGDSHPRLACRPSCDQYRLAGFHCGVVNLSFGTDRALNRPFVRSWGPSLPGHVASQVALSLTGLPFSSATKALKGCIQSLELISFVLSRTVLSLDGSAGVVSSCRRLGALVGRIHFLDMYSQHE